MESLITAYCPAYGLIYFSVFPNSEKGKGMSLLLLIRESRYPCPVSLTLCFFLPFCWLACTPWRVYFLSPFPFNHNPPPTAGFHPCSEELLQTRMETCESILEIEIVSVAVDSFYVYTFTACKLDLDSFLC